MILFFFDFLWDNDYISNSNRLRLTSFQTSVLFFTTSNFSLTTRVSIKAGCTQDEYGNIDMLKHWFETDLNTNIHGETGYLEPFSQCFKGQMVKQILPSV